MGMLNIGEFAVKRSAPLAVFVFASSGVMTVAFWALRPARFRLPAAEQSDYYGFYEPVARNIVAGRGISLQDEKPATLFPPGCPLILSGLFSVSHQIGISEPFVLSAFSILSMAVVSALVFLMGRIVLSAQAALASAAIWMTYPLAQWLTVHPNSEASFLLFLYAGLAVFSYLVTRPPRSWALVSL